MRNHKMRLFASWAVVLAVLIRKIDNLYLELTFDSVSILIVVVDSENGGIVLFVGANSVKQDTSLDSSRTIALNLNQLNNVLLLTGG